MNPAPNLNRLRVAVQRRRLVDSATKLIAARSPTGAAQGAAACLAEMLSADGFLVERPEAGHAKAPAVVVRMHSNRPGRTLQFNGHLDVVHLPYVPAAIHGDQIVGSGSCD